MVTSKGHGGLSQNRKRRVIGNGYADGGQQGGRRASSIITMQVLRGHSREPLRPPHPWPKAEHRAVASSFFSFERDPHDLNPHDSISKSQDATTLL